MKTNPGRKERRKDIKGNNQLLGFLGKLNPTKKVPAHSLTKKRREMLKKYPNRILPSEKELIKNNPI